MLVVEGHHERVHENDMAGPKAEGGSSFTSSGAAICSDCFVDGSIKWLLCKILVLVLLYPFF